MISRRPARRALVKSRALDPADAFSLVREVLGASGIALPGRLDRQPTAHRLGGARLLSSMKPSKADGRDINAARSSAQTSAIMPGSVPCGVSCHLQAALFQPGVHRGKVELRHPL